MRQSDPFCDTDETRAALMRATYDALCTHGYADITIQRIGDEFPKSKSLIYQHYDGKDELLVAFLEAMIEHFETEIPVEDSAAASDRLQTLFDHVFALFEGERGEFANAMTELRAQAPHDKAYREHFTRSDRIRHEHIADIIRMGIEDGEFKAVDADQTAELLLTTIEGTMLRQTTTDGTVDVSEIREEIEGYVHCKLIENETEETR